MKTLSTDFKAGLFVIVGVFLFCAAVLTLGGQNRFMTRTEAYYTHFYSVDGLMVGAKVVLSGIQVGNVEDIFIDTRTQDVSVKLSIQSRFIQWLREGTQAEMATMGVLGDKFIKLTRGKQDGEQIPGGSIIPVSSSKDLSQVLNKGDALLVTLNSIAGGFEKLVKGFEKSNRSENIADGLSKATLNLASVTQKLDKEIDRAQLGEAVRNLNLILSKINDGQGTLGALINDPGLYDDAKALLGGANRSRIVRNMVRQTIKGSDKTDTAPQK